MSAFQYKIIHCFFQSLDLGEVFGKLLAFSLSVLRTWGILLTSRHIPTPSFHVDVNFKNVSLGIDEQEKRSRAP